MPWDGVGFEGFVSIDPETLRAVLDHLLVIVTAVGLSYHLSAPAKEDLWERMLGWFAKNGEELVTLWRQGQFPEARVWLKARELARSLRYRRYEYAASDLGPGGLDLDALPGTEGRDPLGPSKAETQAMARRLRRELHRHLTPLELQAYRLRVLEHQTYEEIGKRLGRSPEACRKLCDRAGQKLEKIKKLSTAISACSDATYTHQRSSPSSRFRPIRRPVLCPYMWRDSFRTNRVAPMGSGGPRALLPPGGT